MFWSKSYIKSRRCRSIDFLLQTSTFYLNRSTRRGLSIKTGWFWYPAWICLFNFASPLSFKLLTNFSSVTQLSAQLIIALIFQLFLTPKSGCLFRFVQMFIAGNTEKSIGVFPANFFIRFQHIRFLIFAPLMCRRLSLKFDSLSFLIYCRPILYVRICEWLIFLCKNWKKTLIENGIFV